jgi:cold shock CspA family protein
MYNDSKGYGTINLETQKRDIIVTAGSVETLEFIRQTHIRNQYNNDTNKNMKRKHIIKSDYALKWKLSVPAALNDTFITVQDLRSSNIIIGTLDILVYVQPTNDLYMTLPGRPAGVFSYNIVMERLGDPTEMTNNTEYPFVWKDDGPVELDQYFGY